MRRIASVLSGAIARLSILVHSHSIRVWLLWGCGALALMALPVALMDPAVLMLLLDPELLALLVVSALGVVRVRLGRGSEQEQP